MSIGCNIELALKKSTKINLVLSQAKLAPNSSDILHYSVDNCIYRIKKECHVENRTIYRCF